MYGPSARMRAEREETRRSNAGVIISTVLSLLVVAAAVAVVAYLVLREPSTAVDSAERLDPVGTALPAPTSPPELPTAVPTPAAPAEVEPTALGFSGEQPAVAGLPTVAAPEDDAAGPTPTPRLIAQPTDVPPTPIPPAPTLPPSVPVTEVPVVALQPVEAAPSAPTSAPAPEQSSQPTPASRDDDPFNIFDDQNESRIVPAVDDPLQRVRDMQDEQRRNSQDQGSSDSERGRRDDPVIMPTVEVPDVIVPRTVNGNGNDNDRSDPSVAGVPDVDAMIDEITARATDPNRNPNVAPRGRSVIVPSNDKKDDKTNGRSVSPSKSRKNPRDRAEDEKDKDKEKDRPGATRPNFPSIQPTSPNGRDNDSGVCTDPTAPGFPFDC